MNRDRLALALGRVPPRARPIVNRTRFALAVLWTALAACGQDEGAGPPPAEGVYDGAGRLLSGSRRVTAPPNVILICIDTMRGDSIEARGGAPPPCPNVLRFAGQCVRFANASSSAAWTAPSIATLVTGLLPSRHGVEGTLSAPPLTAAVATLAEYLKSAGYATEAMTGGGWITADMGHMQGFDRFTENWSFFDEEAAVTRWARSRAPSKPFFLFLHTYDAHDPYGRKRPPEGSDDPKRVEETERLVARLKAYDALHRDDFEQESAEEILFAWRADPLKHRALEKAFGEGRFQGVVLKYDLTTFPTAPNRDDVAARLRAKYVDGLRATDGAFEGVLATLDGAGIPVNTLTLLVSDHGEAFGEHDDLGHGRWLYDELTRVVLLARAPGRFPPRVATESVGLVDVVPTILDVCGLPPAKGLDGTSFLPVLEGKGHGRPIRAEERRFALEGKQRVGLRVVSVRSDRAKWISTWDPRRSGPTEEVYDLEADRAEKRPLSLDAVARFGADFAAEVARARETVRTFRAQGPDGNVRAPGGG